MELNLEKICFEVVELARKTGYVIKAERQKNGLDIQNKGTNDFVTHVDKLSEELLVAGLQQLVPDAGFIAEENTKSNKGEQYNWIIDPIDGTTNFIHGLSPFAISIALMDNDDLVLGVVFEMGLDECFYAWKNGGAWMDGLPIKVSNRPKVSDCLIATGFPYTSFTLIGRFLASLDFFMQKSHGIRRLGSAATDMAYVACGRLDAFYEYNLNAWDVAAGAVIVTEAGGRVSDFVMGNDFLFGKQVIACNGLVYDEFASNVKSILVD